MAVATFSEELKSVKRAFTVTTNLKGFRVVSLHGKEELSQLSIYELELAVKKDQKRSLDDFVETDITLNIRWQNPENKILNERYVHAVIGRVAIAEESSLEYRYMLQCHPWLWLLKFSSHTRIFQNLKATDIIKQVFDKAGFSGKYRFDLQEGDYQKREYCVQYQETDFAFACRLMEDEGIYYYFEYTEDDYLLVLGDKVKKKEYDKLSPATIQYNTSDKLDSENFWLGIKRCHLSKQVSVSSYELDDFNFTAPKSQLLSKKKMGKSESVLYEYPGRYEEKKQGTRKVERRLDAQQSSEYQLEGLANACVMIPGYRFEMKGHPTFEDRYYLIFQVEFWCDENEYRNQFIAYYDDKICRPVPRTSKPKIQGSQTAIVTGPVGEEIYTDKYGRIKVQFHWDQEGKEDENSSCWIRVAQTWAGNRWGALFIPRVGQEVLVTFLEGDPDQPLITGCVYNANNMPPYELPDKRTQSVLKSHTVKGSQSDCNEIRFEDKEGKEEFFVQAQKNFVMETKNDYKSTIKNNRTIIIEEKDDALEVKKGKRSVSVKDKESHKNDSDFNHTVEGNYKLKIEGNYTLDVSGDVTIIARSIKEEAKTSLKMKAGVDAKLEATTIKLSGTQTTVEGTAMTEVKGSMLNLKGAALTIIEGGLVKIN